jgi:CheY-like chemotaxis protein
MSEQLYDVIILDDEVSLTDLFQQYILWKYKEWRFLTLNNSQVTYDAIVSGKVGARVWVVDLMMPNKNGSDIAEAIRTHLGPLPIILAYTALDRHTIETHENYKHGLKHFSHIVNKKDDFSSILALIDMWVKSPAAA